MKRKSCQNWRLYVITDERAGRGRDLAEIVRLAVRGGADAIQLRNKTVSDARLAEKGRALLRVARELGVPLIVNDRAEVAQAIGADGVHLGQEDGSLRAARERLGEEAIIGRSTHSPEQALEAQKEGFDYIGVGPVFATPTKTAYKPVGLELIRFAAANISIPFVAIGGIDETNVHDVRKAGASTVAVVRAIMEAERPDQTARKLLE